MTQQIINVGASPDDGEGDTLRNGMIKVNDNFTDLYTQVSTNETNIATNTTNIATNTTNITALSNRTNSVVNGGTGLSSLTAHGILVGEGLSNVNLVGPSATIGLALISQGSSADPIYSVLSPTGGGTGNNTLTAHGVLIGEGVSPVNVAATSATAGVALVSTGSTTDPAFGTVVPAGGGTGLTTITQYAVMLGGGTGNVSTASPTATSGIPLISQGVTANPIFGTVTPAGGGTGQTSLTAHAVIIGEGTNSVNTIGPNATSGLPLISQGSSSDPAFGTAVVAGGGTGLATITQYAVLLGNGTGNIATVGPSSTTGQALIAQGSSANPIFGYPTGSLLNVRTFTSSTTYTPTTGTNSIIVYVLGGGGAGGGAATTASTTVSTGGGGAAGALAISRLTTGFSGATITIGTGGTGSAGATGGVGGNTVFGSITANGGGAGGAGTVGTGSSASGGIGGTTSTGNLFNTQGTSGFYGWANNSGLVFGGIGASSQFGAGGGYAYEATGGVGSGYGSGGGGAANSISESTAYAGGAGTAGIVIVYEYA
jgi:hypothetical protein